MLKLTSLVNFIVEEKREILSVLKGKTFSDFNTFKKKILDACKLNWSQKCKIMSCLIS